MNLTDVKPFQARVERCFGSGRARLVAWVVRSGEWKFRISNCHCCIILQKRFVFVRGRNDGNAAATSLASLIYFIENHDSKILIARDRTIRTMRLTKQSVTLLYLSSCKIFANLLFLYGFFSFGYNDSRTSTPNDIPSTIWPNQNDSKPWR